MCCVLFSDMLYMSVRYVTPCGQLWKSWKKRARREIAKTMSNNLRILPTHQTTSKHTMSTVNSPSLSMVLTVISANIEGFTASKASMLS